MQRSLRVGGRSAGWERAAVSAASQVGREKGVADVGVLASSSKYCQTAQPVPAARGLVPGGSRAVSGARHPRGVYLSERAGWTARVGLPPPPWSRSRVVCHTRRPSLHPAGQCLRQGTNRRRGVPLNPKAASPSFPAASPLAPLPLPLLLPLLIRCPCRLVPARKGTLRTASTQQAGRGGVPVSVRRATKPAPRRSDAPADLNRRWWPKRKTEKTR